MRRKIIKQGAATLTVSLPAKWTKKFSLKSGDELDLEEKNTALIVTSAKAAEHKKETLDLSKLDTLTKRIVASKYLEGVDEIEVKFNTLNKARIIQQRVRDMIGMEVIQQGKNFLVIKDISGATEKALDPIVRRIFFMISSLAEECLNSISNRETDLTYLEDMENNIDRFTDHCLRILVKYGYSDYWKTPIVYTIILLLEQLADEYRIFTNYITRNKIKLDQSNIEIFEDIHKLFKQFENLFYGFSYEKAAIMAKERDKIIAEIDRKISKTKSVQESQILRSLREMTELIIRMMGQNLTLS